MMYAAFGFSALCVVVSIAPVAIAQQNPPTPPPAPAPAPDDPKPDAPRTGQGNQIEQQQRGNEATPDRNATERDAMADDGDDRDDADDRGEYPEKAPAIPQVSPDTPSGRFGANGQMAISSDTGLFIENTSQSGDSTTTLVVRPALDYFVADNLSFGGFLGVEYSKVPSGDSTTWALGPRVGYNIPVSERFSIWPKAGLSFTTTSTSTDNPLPGQDEDSTASNLAVNLFVPVMFHPVEHFFLGFGPALDADLSGDVKTTTIAGRLTIGGWFFD
jgi:hypothetical protein